LSSSKWYRKIFKDVYPMDIHEEDKK